MINDILYCGFVNNLLSGEQMKVVEKEIIEDGEADGTIAASIMNYEQNEIAARDILGEDRENICNSQDRIMATGDSNGINKNTYNMKTQLSEKELLAVNEILNEIKNSKDNNLSLEENLVEFYLAKRPGTTREEAEEVMKAFETGILKFNNSLKEALAEGGFDYKKELAEATKDMSLQQKYELYVNFLAALATLEYSNLSEDQKSQVKDFETIKGEISVNAEVTEEMIAEIESRISECMENNTLCMGTLESFGKLVSALSVGEEQVAAIANCSADDMEEKMETSLAVYIAYLNGDIESNQEEAVTPEMIAVATASGVEQRRVISDLASGKTTIDVAIKVLKIIGGITLALLLGFAAVCTVSYACSLIVSTCIYLFGLSGFAFVIALLSGFGIGLLAGESAVEIYNKVAAVGSKWIDVAVQTWREKTWPAIRKWFGSVTNFFSNLFSSGVVTQNAPIQVAPTTVNG